MPGERPAWRPRVGGLGFRIFFGFLIVVGVMVMVSGVVFVSLFDGYRESLDRSELRSAAAAAAAAVVREIRAGVTVEEVGELVREVEEHSDIQLLLTHPDGTLLAGAEPAPRLRGERLPISAARIRAGAGGDGWFVGNVQLISDVQPFAATALPVVWKGAGGKQTGVLLVAVWTEGRTESLREDLQDRLLFSAFAGIAVAAVIAVLLSRSLVNPIQGLTNAMRRFGRGERGARAEERGAAQFRELAGEFNAMAGRVEANDRAMRGFIADVSHELRTPLTAIRGFTQALVDGDVPEDRRQRSLEVIQDETRRILRMVEQLLDLSRLEAGQQALRPSAVSPRELIDHTADLFEQRADAAGVGLVREIGADAPEIRGDFDRLGQVLNNLAENALRHTEAGTVTLAAAGSERPGWLRIEVRDTGSGIAAEDLPHLFDRFWQPSDRSGPGAGLGLAISREIVRAHGGEISAESRPGEGAVFRILLPPEPPAGADAGPDERGESA